MKILPYHLTKTNDLLTSRAGLVCLGELMQSVGFSNRVDQYFPQPGSNRGFKASSFVNAMMLMLHEGGKCLEDLRHLREDHGIRQLLGMGSVPTPDAMGDWLRRTADESLTGLTQVNRYLLAANLLYCKKVTLDIDATLSASKHHEAQWTYKKCKGYMPMVGHIAETGQIVATEFRQGNVAPAFDNLAFIKRCEAALPKDVQVKAVRIDAAGYQYAIIDDCIEKGRDFAIRARMCASLKNLIKQQPGDCWQPLIGKKGQLVEHESTCRVVHMMTKSKHPFTVVIQRKCIKGQVKLEWDEAKEQGAEIIEQNGYRYRAIATNRDQLTDSEIVHWYNQRAEHSENRIKELKCDFAAQRMPCKNFKASALYFALCALAYNLFALLRAKLPAKWQNARAKIIRLRVYAIAAKVVTHGRRIYLKVQRCHQSVIAQALASIRYTPQPP